MWRDWLWLDWSAVILKKIFKLQLSEVFLLNLVKLRIDLVGHSIILKEAEDNKSLQFGYLRAI